jgi:predicted metal-binding protein
VIDRERIEQTARENGWTDFKWIAGRDVQVREWVRFKCMFGCGSYGKKGGCPPAVPSIPQCRELFNEYEHILVIHLSATFAHPDERKEFSRKHNAELLKLERAVFLAGHHKALLLFMDECRVCAECPGTRLECRNPRLSRPCPEALGVDVFSTVQSIGFSIEVLTDYTKTMNRYSFLLVE